MGVSVPNIGVESVPKNFGKVMKPKILSMARQIL
jgi:hypothetical protein